MKTDPSELHSTAQPTAAPSGADGRQTVVLLHSSGASSRQWDALAASLRPTCEVRAVDLHGHGRQAAWSHDRPMSVDDEAALVLRLIEGAGPVHLIGHSYGGAVALHLAVSRPAHVRSLAVFEPVLFGMLIQHEPQGEATREVIDVAEDMRRLIAQGEAAAAAERFVDYWSGAGAWPQLPPPLQQAVASRIASVMQQFDVVFREQLPPARLARLNMPVLCLSGGRSTPAAQRIAALLRTGLPRARHETLERVGHLAPITHAPLVNERLQHFLAGQMASAPSGPALPAAAAAAA
ncbi:MAG: alpha/beta hydrolase [Rubrivivax sp.]|nr:alpha/beta hydrolase [Rubrivivax sp.]